MITHTSKPVVIAMYANKVTLSIKTTIAADLTTEGISQITDEAAKKIKSERGQDATGWIVNLLKGISSRKLRSLFPHLTRLCGKDKLWTQAYYVGTAGSVSTEIIRKYISQCQGK